MNVAVVNIREMRVRMGNTRVLMGVRVRLFSVPLEIVRVLVMLVVPVAVVVVQDFVSVKMFVPFTNMQPDSQSHERGGYPEQQRRQFRPQNER